MLRPRRPEIAQDVPRRPADPDHPARPGGRAHLDNAQRDLAGAWRDHAWGDDDVVAWSDADDALEVTFDEFDGQEWLAEEAWVDVGRERRPLSRRAAGRITAGALVLAVVLLVAAVTVVSTALDSDGTPAATNAEEFALATAAVPRRLPASSTVRWEAVEAGVPTGQLAVGEEVAAVAVRSGAGRSDATVIAYDLDTGEERWRRDFESFPGRSQVIATGFGVVLITLASEADGTVLALEETSGEQRWAFGIRGFDGVFVLPAIDAVLHVGDAVRFVDPTTGSAFATITDQVFGVDLEGALFYADDGEVVAARVVDGDLVETAIAQLGDRRVTPLAVVDDRVIGFDDTGAVWALAAAGDPSADEQRLPIVGLDEPDEFDGNGILGVADDRVLVIDDDEVFGMELVDDELVVRWTSQVVAFDVAPTLDTFVVFAGSDADRSRPSSPTRLLDARDGRPLGPADGISIVDEVKLFDDGLIVDRREGDEAGELVAYDLYGVERWRTTRDADGIGIADGVAVIAGRTPDGAVTVAAVGAA